jgi:DNA-binding Lrp family transcriptional regulator
LTEYSPVYSREYLEKTKHTEFVYGRPKELYELDEIDIKIIKELSNNARINIVDLSEKLGMTRDVINYRLKKLTENEVIVQYRCYLNLHNIGINLYKIIF